LLLLTHGDSLDAEARVPVNTDQMLLLICIQDAVAKLLNVGRIPAMKYMLTSIMVNACSLTDAQVGSVRALTLPKSTMRTIAQIKPLVYVSDQAVSDNDRNATYTLPRRKVKVTAILILLVIFRDQIVGSGKTIIATSVMMFGML
jgi:hypothetical protein